MRKNVTRDAEGSINSGNFPIKVEPVNSQLTFF